MQSRLSVPLSQENPLWLSWHDSPWIPILNATNIMDYFQQKSNPFYDRTCNNEIVKMQRLDLDQMNNMVGLEYILLHVQAPILYVIRKQHRHSQNDVTPMADYYIIAGIVYQAPDLASVFNSRLLSIAHHLQTGFEEASSYARYHPNKGYSWDFSSNKALSDKSKYQTKKETEKTKEEPSSMFQRQRVDMLLGELLQKFPLPMPPQINAQQQQQQVSTTSSTTTTTTAAAASSTTSSSVPTSVTTTSSATTTTSAGVTSGQVTNQSNMADVKPNISSTGQITQSNGITSAGSVTSGGGNNANNSGINNTMLSSSSGVGSSGGGGGGIQSLTTTTSTIGSNLSTSSANVTKIIPKIEPNDLMDSNDGIGTVDIKQEIMETSPGSVGGPGSGGGGGSVGVSGIGSSGVGTGVSMDNGIDISGIKMEGNEMKPPPEKKMKL